MRKLLCGFLLSAVLAFGQMAWFPPQGPTTSCSKFTKTAADLTTVAGTEDEALFTLSARGKIVGVTIKHSTAFSGGTLSAMTVSVGDSSSDTAYAGAFNVFQAVAATTLQDTDLFKATTSAANAIHAHFIATGDTMDDVDTGSVDIWVCSVVLP